MKRATRKKAQMKPPAKKQSVPTDAAKGASQIKALKSELNQSQSEAAHSITLIAQIKEQREQLEFQNSLLKTACSDLEQSQRRYADLYNLAPVGFMTLDAKGYVQEFNHTACKLLAHATPHLLGESVIACLAEPDRKAFLKHLWQCQHEQTEQSITLRLANKDAGERQAEFTTRPACDQDAKRGWCRCAIVDVTEKRRIREALSDSEAKFRLLADNVGEVFWFKELDPPRITYVSPAFEHVWGQPVANLYADHECWERAIHPDDLPTVHAAYDAWISGQTDIYRLEYRLLHQDGHTRWISDRGIVISEKDGRPHQISGIARDITERKLAEDEISHARNFAESTLEAVPASLAVLNAEGVIIGTNQAWNEFAYFNGGLDATTGKGVNYLAVCDAAAANGANGAAAFAAGIRDVMSGDSKRFSMEYPCNSPQEQRWFVGYVTPFMGNGPHSVVIAHVNISERKRAEQVIRRLNDELESRVQQRTLELRSTNEELRKQIALREQLEEEILHVSENEQQRIGQDLHDDLGQQLAGIWLLSDVLKSALEKEGSTEVESAEKITGLLKNALALTRSLARGLHPVALQRGGLVAALNELTERTCVLFQVNCRCKCPPDIELDNTTATHLYRIAQEAVTNAVKHGKAKEINIELSSNPHSTVLSVKDQGTSISELDPECKGMGLRIMHYRADMIGGHLDIQCSINESGTTVVCTIPARRVQSPNHHAHAKK